MTSKNEKALSPSSSTSSVGTSTSRQSISDYLIQFKRQTGGGQCITHTWFSPTVKTTTLHVPSDRNDEFLRKVYDYISRTKSDILENPKRGENSITEKIINGLDKFRMFADIDFGVELFERHDLPTNDVELKKWMSDLVRMYDSVIQETYGLDYLCDRVLAIRLPYKIHIIYPSVIVNKKIAESIAIQFVEKLKHHDRFSRIIQNNEKLVDKSVYSTGLRMPGMHKSIMGKKEKMEYEWRTHEHLFGEGTYTHCYRFADPDTFEPIPLTFDLFRRASIHVENEDYTAPLEENAFAPLLKNKGKARLSSGGGGRSATKILRNNSPVVNVDSDGDNGDNGGETEAGFGVHSQQMLISALPNTIRFLRRTYNHLINEDKIKYRQREDADGAVSVSIIIPLDTKECHFAGKMHESNHQYLLIDKSGCRQKCHDCKEAEHKPITPGRLPKNVKDELGKLGVVRSTIPVKLKPEPTEEQKISAVDDLVKRVHHYFPQNELLVNKEGILFNELGIHVPLLDSWCELCKDNHGEPKTYMWVTETGRMCLRCEDKSHLSTYYPNPPLTLDVNTRQFFFSNCNISVVNNSIHNYGENTGDVSLDFEEEPIFDDDVLNHLVYESLAATTWPIVKVIHHLGKYNFNCSKAGDWYTYKNHKWNKNSEGAFLYFISEKVAHYYRQVRDYYRDNTESQELRQKRVSFIQTRIIDRLTNINSKMDMMKEAKTYFYEEDYYALNNNTIHFEQRLDEKRNLLCFTNGVYDLDANLFRDGSPYDFVTLTVGFDYVERSDPRKRAAVEQFFNDIQPDVEERDYLLLFLSSMLHGMTNAETFHIFTGAAANGKSLLRDLLMYTLGEYFMSIPANLLTRERPSSSSPQPEIYNLKGVRAVVGSEPEMGQKINTGFLKWITGNDILQARLLHKNEILSFQPHFKLVLLCNDIPLMDSNDSGTWRRSRIVEFPTFFCENPRSGNKYEKLIDPTLKERIAECREEFMLYLMEYFRKYRDMKSLSPTAKVNRMIHKHKKKSNTVLQFLEEKTVESRGDGILLVDLYPKYIKFMREDNPGEFPVIKSKMIEELQRIRHVEYSKHVRVRGRKGGQQGIRNRRFLEEDDAESDDGGEELTDGNVLLTP